MISAIVAMSENRVIGKNNQLPWHLPADLKHFKNITLGNSILMGRKTYESIGRPLPNRTNLILTRNTHYTAKECVIVRSLEDAIKEAAERQQLLFIIGGAELFNAYLARATQLHLTLIHHTFEGDTFFPMLSSEWHEISRETHRADDLNPYAYSFITYEHSLP